MTREDVTLFVQQTNLATGRRITEAEVELLYRGLTSLDVTDTEFRTIAAAYLDEEDIPRNILKYYRDRVRAKRAALMQKIEQQADAGIGCTPEQAQLFARCVHLAIRAYHGHRETYDRWAAWFNGQWLALSGAALDTFLATERTRLMGGK